MDELIGLGACRAGLGPRRSTRATRLHRALEGFPGAEEGRRQPGARISTPWANPGQYRNRKL